MDHKLFWLINRLSGRTPFIDKLMIFFSNKTRYIFLLIVVLLFFKNHFSRKTALNAVISFFVTLITHRLINSLLYKPRPFIKNRVGILIPSKMNSSFPSKHTILSFAVATSILLRERIIGTFMIVIASLTSFSRIWVGHHYPSDITVSLLIGSTISFAVDKVTSIFKKKADF